MVIPRLSIALNRLVLPTGTHPNGTLLHSFECVYVHCASVAKAVFDASDKCSIWLGTGEAHKETVDLTGQPEEDTEEEEEQEEEEEAEEEQGAKAEPRKG